MSYRVDGLSMLLSSDWFASAWQVCGLSSPESVRQQVQTGCRKIVVNLLAGENSYWDVEFSDARRRITEQHFFDCLARCRTVPRDIGILRQVIKEESSCVELECDRNLVSTLLALLVSEYPRDVGVRDDVSSNIFDVVSRSLNYPSGSIDLKSIAKQADSEWDVWLNKITEDVPRFLVNVSQDIYDACDGFSRSWATINGKLSVDEQEALVRWLNKWGLLLADKIAIPQK